LYASMIKKTFGVVVDSRAFDSRKVKWSRKMAQVFKIDLKPWDYETEIELKTRISELVASRPSEALHPRGRRIMNTLVKKLEERLKLEM